MITLILRNEVAKTKKIIASELTKLQKVFFDEDILQYYKEGNEEHLYQEKFDFYHGELIHFPTFSKVLGTKHGDINSFPETLTNKLTELFQKVEAEEFYLISHLKIDFFGNRENKFKPLVDAYEKLEKITGQNSYKEAFKFSLNDLGDLIGIIFWITRCDPTVAEYFFLFDDEERFQMQLCQYGNIHLTEFGEERITEKLLISIGFTLIEGEEIDNFTNDQQIKGRTLKN